MAAAAGPWAGLTLRATYTYTDARNDATHAPLVRRPREEGGATLAWEPTRRWVLGAGVSGSAGDVDVGFDANTYASENVSLPGYAVARLFASCQVTPRLRLRARLENALDKAYEQVLGYPALPRGLFAGADWRF